MLQVLQTTGMMISMALLGSQGFGRFKERGGEAFQTSDLAASIEAVRHAEYVTFRETFLVAGLLMVAAALLALLLESGHGRRRWGLLVGESAALVDEP
jgi:hypothetical protein